MDPYAAAQHQTYQHPPPSSQFQPQTQDPYIYNQQQYDQSQQHYAYYAQPYDQSQQYDPSQQYANPNPSVMYQHAAPGQEVPQQPQPDQEHAPIHPPGVPVPTDPNQIAAYQQAYAPTHYQTDPNSYYYAQPQHQLSYPDPGMVHQGQQQWQQAQPAEYGLTSLYPPNGQASQYSAPSRGGGSSSRGRGRGGGSARGRGGAGARGGGRGGGRGGRTNTQVQPKPQFLAWCELCRVDCNTHEVLENHKNGKKHKKNLEIQEDLKKLAARTNETQQPYAAVERPEVKVESQTVPLSEEQQNNLKRKMVDEERKSGEIVKKPRESIPVPFICELCDVKCESAPVFDCHLKGRKHSFNLQLFQEQQAALVQVALQALYPVLLQALAQNASTSGGLDQQVLQLLQPYLPQTGPGYFPPGPGFQPHHGPNPGVTLQPVENQVEVKTEDGVGPESKAEEQATQ